MSDILKSFLDWLEQSGYSFVIKTALTILGFGALFGLYYITNKKLVKTQTDLDLTKEQNQEKYEQDQLDLNSKTIDNTKKEISDTELKVKQIESDIEKIKQDDQNKKSNIINLKDWMDLDKKN